MTEIKTEPGGRVRSALGKLGVWTGLGLIYLLAAAVFTWPLAADLGGHVWGERFDVWTTLWLLWHLHDAVSSGTFSVTTDMIFFPVGYNLWSFGHMAWQLLAVPLIAMGLSVTAAYNVLMLGAFAGSSLGAHVLGRAITRTHVGGVIAAAVFTFNPLLYGEMAVGAVELVAAFFLPLYALMLVRLAQKPTWGRALVLALTLALAGPFNWYYSIFCILLTAPLSIAMLIGASRARWLAFAPRLAAAGALVALVTWPLVDNIGKENPPRIPLEFEYQDALMLESQRDFRDGLIDLDDIDRRQMEIFEAIDSFTNSMSVRSLITAEFPVDPMRSTPGLFALLLALGGLVANPRGNWRWALVGGIFGVLSLGPLLRWSEIGAGGMTGVCPLPYYWLYNHLPFFSKAYRPYRLNVVTLTMLAAMAAYLGPWLRARLGDRLAPTAAVALVFVGASQPLWAPGPQPGRQAVSTDVPAYYEEIAGLPGEAIIELPLHCQPPSQSYARLQYYQVVHRKKLLNNNQFIRIPALLQLREMAEANPALDLLLRLDRLDEDEDVRFPHEAWAWFEEQGFRHLVAHSSFTADSMSNSRPQQDRVEMLPGRAFALLGDLFGPAVLENEHVRVYDFGEMRTGDDGLCPPPAERDHRLGDLGTLDAFELGHSIVLHPLAADPTQTVTLGEGAPGEELGAVSFWATGEDCEGVAVRFLDSTGDPLGATSPLMLQYGTWRWIRIEAPPGAAASELVNDGASSLAVQVTALWLEVVEVEVTEEDVTNQEVTP